MIVNTGTDERRPGWYWIDNEFLTSYGAQVGVYGIAVYNVLAMHANRERESWPSLNRIASLIGASKHAVRDALDRLEQAGLVEISERKVEGVNLSNHYGLAHIATLGGGTPQALPLPVGNQGGTPGVRGGTPGVPEQDSLNKTQITRKDSLTQGATYVEPTDPAELPVETDFDRLFKANLITCVQERWPNLAGGFTFAPSTLLLLRQLEASGPLLSGKAIDWALDQWEEAKPAEKFVCSNIGAVNWLLTTVRGYRANGDGRSKRQSRGRTARSAGREETYEEIKARYLPKGYEDIIKY